MPTRHLLYQREYPINDSIRIIIPTVGEIIDDEDNYYGLVKRQVFVCGYWLTRLFPSVYLRLLKS